MDRQSILRVIRKILDYVIESNTASSTNGEESQPADDEPEPDYHSPSLVHLSTGKNCVTVPDPEDDMRSVLRVRYQTDAFDGTNQRDKFRDTVGYEPDVAHARYRIYFPSDWEWMDKGVNGGTKLPGFAHQNECGYSGNECRGEGFSARMFTPRPEGAHGRKCEGDVPLGLQVYDATHDTESHPYGWHHMWGVGANLGGWNTIDYRLELGEPGEQDSRIVGWVNGEKSFEYDRYLFFDRDHADWGIHEWRWHFYFGGSWGSPTDQSLYLRDFSLWVDGNCPSMES